ncbi:MAG: hypothetical protein ACK5FT_10255 [Sphingomonadales bacterium]|jgi:hypothetical protein
MKQRFMAIWASIRQYPLYQIYIVLLLLAFGKQCFYTAELVDSGEYRNAAVNLLAGNGWSACLPNDVCDQLSLPETRRTPGYPILIGITGFTGILLLIQTILVACIPYLMHKLLVKMGKESCLKIAMMLLLLYPLQYFYSAMLMPDILCQVGVLCLVIAWIEQRWLWVSILLTLLLLLKPVFMPLAWLVLVAKFWIKNKQRIWLALPVAVVFLVSWLNFRQTGLIHYTSMPVSNAFEYNIRNLTKETSSEDYYRAAALKMDSMDFSGKYLFMQNETTKAIRLSPLKYAYLHMLGACKALIDPGRYDLVAYFKLPQGNGFMSNNGIRAWASQHPLIWVYIVLFALLAFIKTILAVVAMFKPIQHKWILLFPLLYTLLVVGPVGSARYLLPVMPIMIVLAAIGWNSLFNQKHESTAAE